MDSAKRNWEILLLCVLVKLNKNNYSSFTEDIFVIKKRNGYIKTSQKTVLQKFQLKSNFSATLKLAFFFLRRILCWNKHTGKYKPDAYLENHFSHARSAWLTNVNVVFGSWYHNEKYDTVIYNIKIMYSSFNLTNIRLHNEITNKIYLSNYGYYCKN